MGEENDDESTLPERQAHKEVDRYCKRFQTRKMWTDGDQVVGLEEAAGPRDLPKLVEVRLLIEVEGSANARKQLWKKEEEGDPDESEDLLGAR